MDHYVYVITALLPLAAAMVVFQANPYHALVIRGILGAIAALVYTVLGAADVALTEALVGTMLAITLYAVAVRSSLVLRLGVLKEAIMEPDSNLPEASQFQPVLAQLRSMFRKHYLRVEVIPYLDSDDLHQAFIDKEIHATWVRSPADPANPCCTTTRLRRLYEIMHAELTSPVRLYTPEVDSASAQIPSLQPQEKS